MLTSHLPNADNCTHVTHWLFDKGHTRATFNDYTASGLDRALRPDTGPDAGQTLWAARHTCRVRVDTTPMVFTAVIKQNT